MTGPYRKKGNMDIEQVFKLIDAGFTADEIKGFMSGSKEPEPKEPEPKEPEPKEPEPKEPEPKEFEPVGKDIIDALAAQVDKLTRAVQASNVLNNVVDNQQDESIDDVMQMIINRGVKDGK